MEQPTWIQPPAGLAGRHVPQTHRQAHPGILTQHVLYVIVRHPRVDVLQDVCMAELTPRQQVFLPFADVTSFQRHTLQEELEV